MGGGELGVEFQGVCEVLQGFFPPVEDREEEADLVLNAGGLWIQCGGLLPGGEGGGGVTARPGGRGIGFEFAKLGLLGRQ